MHAALSDVAAYRQKYVAAYKIKEHSMGQMSQLRGRISELERQVTGLRRKLGDVTSQLQRLLDVRLDLFEKIESNY